MFCPGRATTLSAFPRRPVPGVLYGLPVGEDWVTVRVELSKHGATYSWCSRLTPGAGSGSRQQFLDWATELAQGAAA